MIQKQVCICGFEREEHLGVSMHAARCCSPSFILGALLGLQAPLEPTQHMSPQKKKEKDRDQEVVLPWCHGFRVIVGKFHYPSMLNLVPQPCLVPWE